MQRKKKQNKNKQTNKSKTKKRQQLFEFIKNSIFFNYTLKMGLPGGTLGRGTQ